MKVIVSTPTLIDYTETVEWALNKGLKWRDGTEDVHNEYWEDVGSEICIFIINKCLYYGRKSYMSINHKDVNMLDMEQFKNHIADDSIFLFGA